MQILAFIKSHSSTNNTKTTNKLDNFVIDWDIAIPNGKCDVYAANGKYSTTVKIPIKARLFIGSAILECTYDVLPYALLQKDYTKLFAIKNFQLNDFMPSKNMKHPIHFHWCRIIDAGLFTNSKIGINTKGHSERFVQCYLCGSILCNDLFLDDNKTLFLVGFDKSAAQTNLMFFFITKQMTNMVTDKGGFRFTIICGKSINNANIEYSMFCEYLFNNDSHTIGFGISNERRTPYQLILVLATCVSIFSIQAHLSMTFSKIDIKIRLEKVELKITITYLANQYSFVFGIKPLSEKIIKSMVNTKRNFYNDKNIRYVDYNGTNLQLKGNTLTATR